MGCLNICYPGQEGIPGVTIHAVCCMIFGGVLERFPKLKVCFAHGDNHYGRLSILGSPGQ